MKSINKLMALGILIFIAWVVFVPLGLIGSLNILFGLNIAYGFPEYISALFLMLIINANLNHRHVK
jgi:hypothetical protein